MRRLLLGALIVLAPVGRAAAAVPSGFAQETYTSPALSVSTAAAFAPDGSGRLFVLNKNGTIRVIRTADGRPITEAGTSTLVTSVFATEPAVYTNSEGGLLGITFDPNYVVNRYLYVFVSVSATEQHIVRYSDAGGGLDAAGTGTERTVIVSRLPTMGENHVGGGLAIGADGKLYFSIGDLGNGTGVDADLTSVASKVSRSNLDGTPVNDNPFNDGVGPNNEYIWARGLRNPFGLVRQPRTGAIWTMVAGTAYEQVFQLERRAHAGYNDYENNQPNQPDNVTPKIVYRTNGVDRRNLTGATRTAGTLTVTTVAAHGFRVGQRVVLADLPNASFAGFVYVRSVPTPTSFTAVQAGPDASVGAGGTAETTYLGGAITRGTFYEGTAFPPDHRGSFFFGDYNSGQLMRAALSATNEVERVDVWATEFGSNVDVTTGEDGALYTLAYVGGALRRVSSTSSTPRLIIGNTRPYVLEGGRAAFTVSLAAAPAANLTVSVARTGGDADIDVHTGGALTFTPTDWRQPRPVVLAAARDADTVADVSTFGVSAPGLPTEQVVATSMERSGPHLVLSTDTLDVPEGGQATVSISWSARLPTTTTVTLRLAGDPDLTVVGSTTLTFTSASSMTPQTVTFAAAQDSDNVPGRAEVIVATALDARTIELVEVDDEAPPPDAGADGGTEDAAAPDAAAPDAAAPGDAAAPNGDAALPQPPEPDSSTSDDAPDESAGGCNGCSTHGRTSTGALWLLLFGLFGLRRRR